MEFFKQGCPEHVPNAFQNYSKLIIWNWAFGQEKNMNYGSGPYSRKHK